MIKITSYTARQPQLIATVTLRDGTVHCDNADLLAAWRYGISGPTADPVFPGQGQAFLDALPYHYTGLLRAEAQP